ncbi:unannotated protein [freshwater metagenome]|uniref:Undecaprenyl-diphosphatase n=1 Tax=freshwater metagenome TaxID=449393 RepID=A0A6J7K1V7_9ZZZZ|nr:undecaprenyl-diphosphate phosphatase [Actinomycetota bacterium]MSW26670.1 undecaprenyl-diphosphate phosphatase [Actinomycetota bacterium]MSW34423.1 undecaprenyl-diphosphate phosphatase [Actinomycetota bacterium]MSX31429.1 undecaprenyl-diphosphate phosphatase [Actinomycetota bacterium]MSX51237.1 undecaprenyl-diphosphate phosphatase [Actinomycetota bacterium]
MGISYLQAIVTGLIQGITELFPVSSLGHAVLVPAWIGGSWSRFTTDPNSPYLTITIALHLASALALLLVFRNRWIDLASAGFNSLRRRPSIESTVFWRIVIATLPVATLGFIFEKSLRELFSKPFASACFLTINGGLLIVAEKRSRSSRETESIMSENQHIAERVSIGGAIGIGFAQSFALFAGVSRFGISMSAGLLRGLKHSTASDFAFLLALPVILGASIAKLPDLFLAQNSHMAGPILAGSFVSFLATYASITFLVRWFKTRTLYPFAMYCFAIGVISIIRFA